MADSLPFGNWTPALFRPHRRSIGGIVAAVTIQETHEDTIQITEHPVEQGAPISDHAYKRPVSVTIRAGWTTANAIDLSAESGVYGLLLSWQVALMPFDVITGKRSYTHMLIERLSVETDQHSEWALLASISCKQVIIATTQTTNVQGMAQSGGDHASPATTGPTEDKSDAPALAVGNNYAPTSAFGTVDPTEGRPYSTSLGMNVDNQLSANGAAPPNNPPVPNTLPMDTTPDRAVSTETQSILTEHQ